MSEMMNRILIQLFHESTKGRNGFTFRELERLFRLDSNTSDFAGCLEELQKDGLIAKETGLSWHKYRLTREGIRAGYNLAEYDLQIRENDLYLSYEPIAALSIGEDSSVLDIGCGAGQTIVAICRHVNPRLAVGIDLEKDNVAFADRQATVHIPSPGARVWSAASADDLPFKDGSFTHAIFRQALYLTDGKRAVSELCRVLKVGGVAYIRVPSYKHVAGYFRRRGLASILRGVFVFLNGLTFSFFKHQIKVYTKSKKLRYCEMFYTRRSIERVCAEHLLEVTFVPTPKGKSGLMLLVRKI